MSEVNKSKSGQKSVPVGYHLLIYREEVRKPTSDQLTLSKAKYKLTNDLVVTTCHNIESYKKEERSHLLNSMAYKSKLKRILERKSKMGNTGSSRK